MTTPQFTANVDQYAAEVRSRVALLAAGAEQAMDADVDREGYILAAMKSMAELCEGQGYDFMLAQAVLSASMAAQAAWELVEHRRKAQ